MTFYRLGKHPATRPHGLRSLAVYANGKLPQPPLSVAVPDVPYPLDGNDRLGDCVACGMAHLLAAWDKEVQGKVHVPDGPEVIDTYYQLTGGQDTGLNESTVLQMWQREGVFGSRIAAYAPVDEDVISLHQAVAFYGGVMLGIACPQSAQQQFQDQEQSGKPVPWTAVPGSPIAGGHCIVGLGYTPAALLCATWGGIAEVTYPFLAAYLDEAWAVVPQAFVAAGRGPSLDLAALEADINQLN